MVKDSCVDLPAGVSISHMSRKPRRPPPPTAPTDLDTLGARVRLVIYLRNLGMNELDRLAKKEHGFTSRLTRSQRQPRADTLGDLAAALRVPADWLLNGPRKPMTDVAGSAERLRATCAAVSAEFGELAGEATLRWAFGAPGHRTNDGRFVVDEELRRLPARAFFVAAVMGNLSYVTGVEDHAAWANKLAFVKVVVDLFLQSNAVALDDMFYDQILDVFTWMMAIHEEARMEAIDEQAIARRLAEFRKKPAKLPLRRMANWSQIVADASERYKTVPKSYFALVGELENVGFADAQLVGEFARALWEASTRSRDARRLTRRRVGAS